MGYQFNFRDGNIVSYLVRSSQPGNNSEPPRLSKDELVKFFRTLMENDRYTSSMPEISVQLKHRVQHCIQHTERIDADEIPVDVVEKILDIIKPFFSFPLICFVVGKSENENLYELHQEISLGLERFGISLIPSSSQSEDSSIWDPFPELASIAQNIHRLPGVVLSMAGESPVYLSLDRLELLREILELIRTRSKESRSFLWHNYESIVAEIRYLLTSKKQSEDGSKIIHISDLHFGSEAARSNSEFLLEHLRNGVFNSEDRLVISGDVLCHPWFSQRSDYFKFRDVLVRNRKKAVFAPGNHDQSWFGIIKFLSGGKDYIPFEKIVLDHELKTIFVCFNSTTKAAIARGHVPTADLNEMSKLLDTNVKVLGLSSYKRIAILHHHPFSFKTPGTKVVGGLLGMFGLTEEKYLYLENADEFVMWCFENGIFLILHGHKHYSKHFIKQSHLGGAQLLSAIGCGASLGADGLPCSYDTVKWSQNQADWAVSFFKADGKERKFFLDRIDLSLVP